MRHWLPKGHFLASFTSILLINVTLTGSGKMEGAITYNDIAVVLVRWGGFITFYSRKTS